MIPLLATHQNLLSSTSVFLSGNSPVTLAIKKTLEPLGIPCQYQSTTIEKNTQFSVPMIIVLSEPYQAVQQIHSLRKFQWQGTFVTLANTLIEKQQLLNLSLFGEKDGKFAYGKIPGHKVAVIHTLLIDIISFQNDPGLSSGAWRDYLTKSSIYTLIQQLQQTSIDIQQVLTTIHSLNILWDTIISHEQARYIRELKQKYPLGTTPPPSEIPQIIANLQARLAHI